MGYSEQENQEYIRFIIELGHKVNEITHDYNKLSDKNKYRFRMSLEETLCLNILCKRY